MATVYTSELTTPTQSTTGTLKRTVSDTIRRLYPGQPILALVSNGPVSVSGGDVTTEKGLIRKRRVNTPKYECFTFTPLAVEYTVASTSDADTFTLSSGDGITNKMCLFNPRNRTICRVQSITSTPQIDVVSVGSTSFATTAGDKLIALAPAYEENSSSPYILQKDFDNIYNFTQISRFAVAISGSAKGNPHYGGDFYMNIKKNAYLDGMRKVENAALLNDRPSSGDSTADSTLGAFRTTRGLVKWAGTTWSAGGSMSADRWITDLSDAMDDTVGQQNDLVALVSTRFYGQMLQWVQDKMMVDLGNDSKLETFGVTAKRFMTARSSKGIRVIVHDAFDHGDMQKNMLIFDPELLEYVYLRDRDFKLKQNIQDNDVDGVKDEVMGEWGISAIDGGQHMILVTDLY